ncbi:MAG: hypothetical protein ACI33P_07375 [Lysinibacillus sp.]
MKKWLVGMLLLVSMYVLAEEAEAKSVIWDGAEVVEGQTGKMTFSKDVKVYKRQSDGTFTSMIVKANSYFRVYTIESYNRSTYYWMSGGYRVQATDLVIFKAVPNHLLNELGTFNKLNTFVYAKSAGGISMKTSPHGSSETIARFPHGTVFKILSVSGDYVRVQYDPYKGGDHLVKGYVLKSFIANLVPQGTMYVQTSGRLGRTLTGEETFHAENVIRNEVITVFFYTGEQAYVRTARGYYGYIAKSHVGNTKHEPKPVAQISSPSVISLNESEKLYWQRGGTSHSLPSGGTLVHQGDGLWKGKGDFVDTETYAEYELTLKTVTTSSSYAIEGSITGIGRREFSYPVASIALTFPVKNGDLAIVDGQRQPVRIESVGTFDGKDYSPVVYIGDSVVLGKHLYLEGNRFDYNIYR